MMGQGNPWSLTGIHHPLVVYPSKMPLPKNSPPQRRRINLGPKSVKKVALTLMVLAQFISGNTIEAHTGLSGLQSKFSMNIRRYSKYELTTIRLASKRFRHGLSGCSHVLYDFSNQFSDAFQSGFRGKPSVPIRVRHLPLEKLV